LKSSACAVDAVQVGHFTQSLGLLTQSSSGVAMAGNKKSFPDKYLRALEFVARQLLTA
jgi:hypothetical protein